MTPPEVAHRFVLLGASNVTLNFPLIVQSLHRSLPGPLEIFSAHGHGRSYCQWSYVFRRGLPGIDSSNLWGDLSSQPAAQRTWGLLTDVGNDLLYGLKPADIMRRVQACIERLQKVDARLLLMRPPIERLLRMTPLGYRAASTLLFPRNRISWPVMRDMAIELDGELQRVGTAAGAAIISPADEWYGIDPIHVRRRFRPAAWSHILNGWNEIPRIEVEPVPRSLAGELWLLRPSERTFRGEPTWTPQPAKTLEQQTRIWLY